MRKTKGRKKKNLLAWIWNQHARLYLDDKGFVLEAQTHPQLVHVGRLVDEVLDAVENATACGRDATMDSSLADGLASDAGVSVDVLGGPTANIK